jgi:hypothetical protein
MNLLGRYHDLAVWAIGDLRREALPSVTLFVALAALTALLSVALLLTQALSLTADRLMTQTPAVVVRRVDAGGWSPLPVGEALAGAQGIAGVLHPRVRIWGVVSSATGPVNVVAATAAPELPPPWSAPLPGQALVGSGIAPGLSAGADLLLTGAQPISLKLAGRLPENSALALHDVALVHVLDARALLALAEDQASDLVVDVFHDQEIEAIVAELIEAMPWPVHITTRPENTRRLRVELATRGAAVSVTLIPAALAVMTMVAAIGLWGRRQRRRMGLFKALGWTSADILHLHLARALLVGLPAMLSGLTAGYLLLFWPGITWVPRLLFGWNAAAPALYLTARSAVGPLILAVLLVAVPYLTASFWAGWQAVAADPADLLEET